MKYGSFGIFLAILIYVLCWEISQRNGGDSPLVYPTEHGEVCAMAAAVSQEAEISTPTAISASKYVSGNSINVDDLVCVDYIYYKVTASSASKRTVCVIGFDEEATEINYVNYIVINGKRYVVTKIDSYAFFGCEVLHGKVELSDNIKDVGGYAFYACINVTEISIGKCLKTIGEKAFYKCKHVTKVRMQRAYSLKKIGSRAFFKLSNKAKIYYKKKSIRKLLKENYNVGKLVKI